MDRYKQSNVVKDYANFLKKMEELKSYIVKFYDDGAIKPKIYPFNCII